MTSWPQLRGQHPKGADRQAEPTQRGREGYPWDFLLLFMPLMGGTIRVFLRSVRGSVVPNGRLLAPAPWPGPRACCPISGSHSERPRGFTPGTFCCCSCPSLEGQSGSFGGVCASIWCPMGGSWLQHHGQHPGRAAQQAGATRNGRGGSPLGLSVVVHAPHGRDNPGVSYLSGERLAPSFLSSM